MKKYLVRFTITSGDYDKEWCYANTPQMAEEIIKNEHWNIQSINYVNEI